MTDLTRIADLFRDIIRHQYQYLSPVLLYILINLLILTVDTLLIAISLSIISTYEKPRCLILKLLYCFFSFIFWLNSDKECRCQDVTYNDSVQWVLIEESSCCSAHSHMQILCSIQMRSLKKYSCFKMHHMIMLNLLK